MTTTPAPVSAKTPPAEEWLASVLGLIDDLDRRTLDRLDALAAAVPEGAGIFPALAAVLSRLEVANMPDPVAAAHNAFAHRIGNRIDRTGRVGAELVANLIAKTRVLIASDEYATNLTTADTDAPIPDLIGIAKALTAGVMAK